MEAGGWSLGELCGHSEVAAALAGTPANSTSALISIPSHVQHNLGLQIHTDRDSLAYGDILIVVRELQAPARGLRANSDAHL